LRSRPRDGRAREAHPTQRCTEIDRLILTAWREKLPVYMETERHRTSRRARRRRVSAESAVVPVSAAIPIVQPGGGS
jgi:hypothetical protein